jgi:hypothetical protein
MQVEVLGGDQRVGDRLLGQVTPFEVVRNHQDQGVFSAASELHIARRDASALASGCPISPVENHPLEQHNGIDLTVRADVVGQVLQFVFVSRRDQEADRVRGGPRGRIVDGYQFHGRLLFGSAQFRRFAD